METIAKIRRDYHVEKKGIKQIARERCVSRNTVRKVIREDEVEFRYERKKPRNSIGMHIESLSPHLTLAMCQNVASCITAALSKKCRPISGMSHIGHASEHLLN